MAKQTKKPQAAADSHGGILIAPNQIERSILCIRDRHFVIDGELAQKLAELERQVGDHDDAIRQLVAAIRQLMAPPPAQPTGKIGFHTGGKP